MFGVRAMRHLWRAKRGLNEAQLHQWLAPVPNAHVRYHVMEIMLVHRRRVNLFELRSTGWKGFRESLEARSVNYTLGLILPGCRARRSRMPDTATRPSTHARRRTRGGPTPPKPTIIHHPLALGRHEAARGRSARARARAVGVF